MPSIEIGTVGGGTVLGPQGACLRVILNYANFSSVSSFSFSFSFLD